MCAYCLNNPTNYVDDAGTDAIWIQEEKSAENQGHTGLMVQDEEGNWFYFFWGPSPEEEESADILKLSLGVPNAAYYVQYIPSTPSLVNLQNDNGVIDAVNEVCDYYGKANRSQLITDTIYLEGDYHKTHDYLKSLFDNNGVCSQQYNLIFNNCVQKSVAALSKSNRLFSTYHRLSPTAILPVVHPNLEYHLLRGKMALISALR